MTPEPIPKPQEKCLAKKKKEKCLKSPPLCKNYNYATIYEITIIQALSDLLFLCRI